MGIRPDFTPDHVRDLKKIGVCDEQIVELRKALVTVSHFLVKQAKNGGTRDVLADVESLSASLLTKLTSLALAIDPEHAKADALIEKSYWQQRPDDDGHTAMVHLIPRLRALNQAAQHGLDQVPTGKPVRHRVASPEPVKRIHTALIYGWNKAHSDGTSYGRGARCEESDSAAVIPQSKASWLRSYPEHLQPSTSPGCAFRTVVGICYDTVDRNDDPERAIREYVGGFKKRRDVDVKATLSLLARRPAK